MLGSGIAPPPCVPKRSAEAGAAGRRHWTEGQETATRDHKN
jgi:hypothetical protein